MVESNVILSTLFCRSTPLGTVHNSISVNIPLHSIAG